MTREEIQEKLAQLCRDLDMNQVYGVLTGLETSIGKPFRFVTFCRARTLDGEIRIYGPKFIMIKSNRTNPEIFKSYDDAVAYIKDTFA